MKTFTLALLVLTACSGAPPQLSGTKQGGVLDADGTPSQQNPGVPTIPSPYAEPSAGQQPPGTAAPSTPSQAPTNIPDATSNDLSDPANVIAIRKRSQAFIHLEKSPPVAVKDDKPSEVCFYTQASYKGTAVCAKEGDKIEASLVKKILSVKIASDMWVELFDQADFKGNSFSASESITSMSGVNFASVTSYRVHKRNNPIKLASLDKGQLTYKVMNDNDQIMDYSTAGYGGGGVKRPLVKVATTLAKPPSGDATAMIQAAIDALGKNALDADGFRGAVKLGLGDWKIGGTIKLRVSGVVLQGTISGGKKTRLVGLGEAHLLVDIQGADRAKFDAKQDVKQDLAATLVPQGSWTLPLKSATGLKKGDTILVQVPVTDAWIKLLGMDKLVRDGAAQTWMKAGALLTMDRVITAVKGNEITLDSPIPHTIRPEYTEAYVETYRQPGRLTNVAIEDMDAVGEFVEGSIRSGTWQFLSLDNVQDAWVHNMIVDDFGGGTIKMMGGAKRITVSKMHANVSEVQDNSAGYAAMYTIMGSQILMRDCSATSPGKIFYVVTQTATMGPNVVLNMFDVGKSIGFIQPHARWAAGLLVDNAVLLGGGVQFIDRLTAGSGHGWSAGHSVAWNSIGDSFDVMSPPKAGSFSVGMIGATSKQLTGHSKGYADSLGALYQDIPSLYLMQLAARKGMAALDW